ncbi:unnamed protein product [Adineta steineri]|uniref:Uncharacterized protein n=1 Tax=Adineta steineri TaxID=433720 RepID=A0A815CDR6_9BILA|nr:unnamed protein product [Adineta steineri]CAF1286978.1 unnamed protein product [Adineta steineri]CAF3571941.1 unnamed protein product [Adineta steineri]CAF3614456.1 unnamed protein product [Adineta steineri]
MNATIADSRPFNDFRKRGMRDFLQPAVSGYKPLYGPQTLFIIGGSNAQPRFMDLQTKINQLINSDKDDSDDDEISPYYQQLLNSVKYIDVCFNTEFKLGDCTIWSCTDIIVDKCTDNKTTTVFINQYAQTSKGSTMRIGVLSFEILKKTQLFVVNQLAINNYTGKSNFSLFHCS